MEVGHFLQTQLVVSSNQSNDVLRQSLYIDLYTDRKAICVACLFKGLQNKMASQNKSKNSSEINSLEPHQLLKQAIEENHIRDFDYSCFKNFEYLGTGGFGKVEKAIYHFAETEIPYALKSLFNIG